jgi:transglutaminase-like putative cysteine protease
MGRGGEVVYRLEQSKIAVTPEIQAKADELTKGKASQQEKIKALNDFVSTRFRYNRRGAGAESL